MAMRKEILYAENIAVSYGEQTVLNFKRFYLYEGEKVGLVGVNGAGKTTLLKVLSGELLPESGSIRREGEAFFLKQFAPKPDPLAVGYEEAGKLKVLDKMWQEEVSGGENTRLLLAELFAAERAVAFLDEPTANLDKTGIEALLKQLKAIETMVLVSHDRAVLNALCTRIVEVEDGELVSYDGNYDAYEAQKAERRAAQQTEYEQYQAEKARLFGVYQEKKKKAAKLSKKPKNMSSSDMKQISKRATRKPEDKVASIERSAKNVQKRISHMEVKERPKEVVSIRPDFRLTNPPRNAIVIRGEHISFGYGERMLFEDCTLMVKNKSRLAILGDNGAGKTTLLEMIMKGEDIRAVPGAKLGYVRQNFSQINLQKTVLENIRNVSVQSEGVARSVLANLLLSERDMKKQAGDLSGGERMKLAFAMLFVSNANVLILDEPTNYLDLPSMKALEKMLKEYEGTLLFTSHDSTFVSQVATDVVEIKNKKIVDICQ
ncbi:MAG: ABC-F family ATP-binding cassette domain-containing protein [Lachnospiraceae bacterium]|nr:ABC-F family ATP-binding cassette domain-containing protein [Lachnospiraceae bacterium]